MICPYCQNMNRDTAKYCDYCGYELPTVAPEAREMFGKDEFFIDGTSAITVDLEGLEKMVDSSNSQAVPTIPLAQPPYDAEYASTVPLSGNPQYTTPIGFSASGVPSPVNYYAQAPNTTSQFQSVGAAGTPGQYDQSDASKQYVAASPKKSKKKRVVMIILILLAIAALIAGGLYAAYSMQIWGGKVVPDVIRQTEEAAVASLSDEGFSANVRYVVADDVEGIVIACDPQAGTRVEEGSTVTLEVSIPRVIPKVIGKSQDDAMAELEHSGYLDVEIVPQKSNEAEGTVLAVNPSEGEQATSDAHIVLTVAESYKVPSVVGMSKDEAVAALEAQGYVVSFGSVNTEDVAEGMAVSTEPAADTAYPTGSTVKLLLAHNRSTELIAAVRDYFANTQTFTMKGQNYQLGEVKAVTYKGNDVCGYSITARPYETHSWFGQEPETRYGNYETIDGTMTFNASNEVLSTDPVITRG